MLTKRRLITTSQGADVADNFDPIHGEVDVNVL
jgi:hypothetical protein